MKILRVISLVAVAAFLSTYMGCKSKGTDPQPIADVQFTKLAKTWKVSTVSFDGSDRTGDFTGFQLVLGGTKGNPPFSYTTTNRPSISPWKASGTWEFGPAVETNIVRDKGVAADELTMTYTVTESTLTLTFTFARDGYTTRTEQVRGPWIFTFTL
ncbi:MAG: hypothetical protein KF763_10620 [Cyclobacteriaceae bacterium]|nr:hypothetical protein [Cyclobacteriaceae bacterium]